ncbi:transposase [Leptolyngbya sp. DQ-M1]|uniref:transposase family protein n=1 Tax=Leptolyngbya sp. DQ-M1 TaxID=2933920 RepID=UPI00329A54E1
MTYEQLKTLKPSAFKRRCGVHPETFEQMVEGLRPDLDRAGKRGGQAKCGKKRKHTLKAQVVVDQSTGQIICTAFSKGRVHDFRVFKQYRSPMLPEQLCLAGTGYQGLAKLHPYSCTPTKKSAKSKLDKEERHYNQMLASLRIVAEHTNRRFKIWRILAERYPHLLASRSARRRRFGLRFNLIAAIVNIELARSS